MKDKDIERNRYNSKSSELLKNYPRLDSIPNGIFNVEYELRTPYIEYYRLIKKFCNSKKVVLELGAGHGKHTGNILETNAKLIASDISEVSLEIIKKRFPFAKNLKTELCDMENINNLDQKFDVITSANALSYGDQKLVMENIFNALKPGGVFICVDSLDENIIFRINRFVNFLRGKRTFSTLKRMPNMKSIRMFKNRIKRRYIL